MFVHWRENTTYVGFLLDSTNKDHLIPGAVVFTIQSFILLEKKFVQTIDADVVDLVYHFTLLIPFFTPRLIDIHNQSLQP